MARVKRGVTSRARHKSVFNKTKGFRHGRKNLIKVAKQAADKAEKNAFIGRKLKKRQFRALWIIKINAACRQEGVSYSQLINGLKTNKIDINRKDLSLMASDKPEGFKKLVEKVKS